MDSEFKLAYPNDSLATMTVTMTIGEWKTVRAALTQTQAWHTTAESFAYMIRDLVKKAEMEFESTGEARSA